jgi:biotin transport system substrate-specific component
MKLSVRGIVFAALFAALLAVLSFVEIHLPFTQVPITMENLAVMLAGAILGASYGFFSMLLVVVLTVLGLPLLHNAGGIGVIIGPTGGYIWAWPICALVTGWFVRRIKGNGILAFIRIFLVAYVFGDLISYIPGCLWLAHVAHLSLGKALVGGCYPFLPGDAVKAFLTAVIVLPIRRVYPISRILGSHGAVVQFKDDEAAV